MSTKTPRVSVLQTGVANTASVLAGLKKAGAEASLTQSAKALKDEPYVVLPGVGTFGSTMETLHEHQLVAPLRDRIASGAPTLLVCVGFQLLFERSEESPGVEGLGVIPGCVGRFPDTVRVPQFGWNLLTASANCELLKDGYAYFANSYRAEEVSDGWSAAYAENGGRFVAAVERDGVMGCQFHPELSSAWGIDLLARWLRR